MGNNRIMPFNDLGNQCQHDNTENLNNLITIEEGEAFTNSEAIAEGAGYEHATVVKLIKSYQERLEEKFGPLRFKIRVRENNGLPSKVFLLNELQATSLMTLMRNNKAVVDFKLRLVEEFNKLKTEAKQPAPALPASELSRMEILQIAMESEKERLRLTETAERQAAQIADLTPKAQYAQTVLTVDKQALDMHTTAKRLKVGPRKFSDFLIIIGFRTQNPPCLPYQTFIDRGYAEVSETYWEHPHKGEQISQKTMITPKDRVWIAHKVAKYRGFFEMKQAKYEPYLFEPLEERRYFLNTHCAVEIEKEAAHG